MLLVKQLAEVIGVPVRLFSQFAFEHRIALYDGSFSRKGFRVVLLTGKDFCLDNSFAFQRLVYRTFGGYFLQALPLFFVKIAHEL